MKAIYKVCKNLIAIALLFFFQLNFASAQVQTARPNTVIDNDCHGFYEYLPQGYSTGSQTYPLIVFVHGTGELGNGSATSLPTVLRNGPPKLINNGTWPGTFTVNSQSFKFIVISPQFSVWPTQADMLDVMNYAISHYRVDKTRVYLTGLSMGGGAVWDFASSTSTPTNAQMLAAIVPISGAASPTMQKATQLVKNQMPVWAFHNQTDGTVTPQNTIGFINDINTARATAIANGQNPGPVPKMTIFPVSGHDAWTHAYDPTYRENNLNVYEWMLTYTRSASTTNSPPAANAGGDKTITLPTNSVALSGTGTDADGTIKSYAWTKTAGPTQFTISNAAVSNPTISNLVAGTYTFRLTVTDNLGATGFDDINIVVNAAVANTPPVANAGPDQSITLPTSSVTLAGSGTDADGTIKTYAWSKTAGPTAFTISNAAIVNPIISALLAGTYTFRLTVTDNSGATAYDDVNIIVNPAGTAPVSGTINVNIYSGANPITDAQWNNWSISSGAATNITSSAFKYSTGTVSTVVANLSQSTAVSDNGLGYPMSGAVMAPTEVLRYTSYSTASRTLTLSGLSTSGTYSLDVYCSRNNKPGNSTIIKTGSQTQTIVTNKNFTSKASFTNLVPDAQGKITLAISQAGEFNYINGFTLSGTGSTAGTGGGELTIGSLDMTAEDAQNTLKVVPNPVHDNFTLDLVNSEIGNLQVQVVSINGAVVKTVSIAKNQSHITQNISIGNLPSGTYMVHVQIKTWSRVVKILKL